MPSTPNPLVSEFKFDLLAPQEMVGYLLALWRGYANFSITGLLQIIERPVNKS